MVQQHKSKIFTKKAKETLKDLGIVIGVVTAMTILLYIFTGGGGKVKIPQNLLNNIDSLKAENAKLKESQKKLDSLAVLYDNQLKEIDIRISKIKEKTTIIREYYHNKIIEVDKYSKKEIEDFLKNRYK